jgi:inorganic pyrophosphatase
MNLAKLPHNLDTKKNECRAVIETPKGRRNKFDYDPELEAFTLGGLLPEGMSFPYDFGFVPSTTAADKDAIDVLVLLDEPAHVGCVLTVRLIGVMEAEQSSKGKTTRNDRLIGVAVHSYEHENIKSVKELNQPFLDQLEQFFISYNKSRGKKFTVKGMHGPSRALRCVQQAIRAHDSGK